LFLITHAMSLTRRQTLAGLSLASGLLLARGSAGAQPAASRLALLLRDRSRGGTTRQAAEGPFYIDEKLERSDISDGRPGIPLTLDLEIVEARNRSPLSGARIDIWHADAAGCYSGFQGQGDERAISTVDQRYLRGTQFANATGKAGFATIYPGWYAGRTAHIHFKVFIDDKPVSLGQIYLPDDLNRFVFTTVPPYSARKRRRDTLNREDQVLASTGGRDAFAKVDIAPDRLIASLTIVVG
jgi:protocatechuate 3,4-dioxygenase beta subunit